MPTVEALTRTYFDAPAQLSGGRWNVTPRKLVEFRLGDSTIVRSSNPKGYLMPDVDFFVRSSGYEGTVRPDSNAVEIGETDIIVLISTTDEDARHIFPALQIRNFGAFVVTEPILHTSGLRGSHELPSPIIQPDFFKTAWGQPKNLIDHQLEDTPALAVINASMMPTADPLVESPHNLRADAAVAEVATRIAGI